MPDLIPLRANIFQQPTRPGVSARDLYVFLALHPGAWAKWTKKNIVTNPYAVEHEDWEGLQPQVVNRVNTEVGGRPTQDYVLSIEFAKKLAMMARSAKGEEARTYFLECERIAHNDAVLPRVHDPKTQIAIQTLMRLDDAEHRIAQLEAASHAAELQAARAETKADMALDDAHRFTLEEFIGRNGLLRQFPEATWTEAARWLKTFCGDYGLSITKTPVPGKPWTDENAYPLQALMAWQRFALRTRGNDAQFLITDDGISYTPTAKETS